jgi:flagellar biosynthetic protein FliQ
MDIMRQMLLVCIQVAGPVLLISVVVGLIVAIFQAATQIHEQTLTFVPKVLAIALTLLLMGGWIGTVLIEFVNRVFQLMAAG